MNIVTELIIAQRKLEGLNMAPEAETMRIARGLITSIHQKLDGKEWDSETTEAISEILDNYGLECRRPDDCDCDDRSWHGDVHDSACPLAGLNRETE